MIGEPVRAGADVDDPEWPTGLPRPVFGTQTGTGLLSMGQDKEGTGATARGPRGAGNDTFQEGEWDLPGRQGVHFGTAQFDRLAVGGTWPSRLLSL